MRAAREDGLSAGRKPLAVGSPERGGWVVELPPNTVPTFGLLAASGLVTNLITTGTRLRKV